MIDKKYAGWRKWAILFIVCAGIFIPNFTLYQISAFGIRIMENLSLTDTQFSSVCTAPMLPGFLFSLIIGLLVDRFGAKRVGFVCFLITLAGSVLHVFASSYATLLIAMILVGVVAAYVNTNVAKIFGGWFSPARANLVIGIYLALASLGMTAGMGTATYFSSIHNAFVFSAIITVAGVVLWLIFMRDARGSTGIREEAPMREALAVSIKKPGVWALGFVLGLICAVNVGVSIFLPTALQSRGLSEETASRLGMFFTIGGMMGCVFTPILDRKLHRRRLLMCICGIAGAFGTAFCWRAENQILCAAGIFISGWVILGVAPMILALTTQIKGIGSRYAGTAGGLVSMTQLLMTVALPTYVITPLSGGNYETMFMLLGLLSLMFSGFCFLLPDPSRVGKVNRAGNTSERDLVQK